jgi:hypothetical protein
VRAIFRLTQQAARRDAARHFTATEKGIARPPALAWRAQRGADQIGGDRAPQRATESQTQSSAAEGRAMTGVYRSDLACRVTHLCYDFCSRMGKLHIDARDHCDARPTLALFRAIDADVTQISVLSGDEARDRIYSRTGERWTIYDESGFAHGSLREEAHEGEPTEGDTADAGSER